MCVCVYIYIHTHLHSCVFIVKLLKITSWNKIQLKTKNLFSHTTYTNNHDVFGFTYI